MASWTANRNAAPSQAPSEGAPESAGPSLRLVSCDANHFSGTWGPVNVVIWRREPLVETVRLLQIRLRAFAQSCATGRCSLLTIVEAGAPMPSAEARTALANMLRFNASEVICSAVAMEGVGFRAAAVRAVADGLSIVARQPFPHKTFATADAATSWLGSQLAKARVSADISSLKEAIAAVRLQGRAD
jgi:hypothetical protein